MDVRTRRSVPALLFALVLLTAACSHNRIPGRVAAGGSLTGSQATADDQGVDSAATGTGGPTTPGADASAPGLQSGRRGPNGPATGPTGTNQGPGDPGTDPSGPTTGSTVGVTATSIKIGVSAPFSGVYGPVADKIYNNGFNVWKEEVNRKGGIHGRQIQLVKIDNQNTAEGAQAACKDAKSKGVFMVVNMLGFTSETDCEDAAGIVVVDLSPAYLKPWRLVLPNFYLPSVAATEVSFLASPFMNAKGKAIGIIYDGATPLAVSAYEAVNAELRKQGFNVVHAEKFVTFQTSFVAEMRRMRDSGAETVLIYAALETTGIIRDAKASLFNPQWFASAWGASTDIISKAANEDLRGVRGVRRMTTAETPEFQGYQGKVRTYAGDSAARNADTTDMLGYALSDTVGQILRLVGRSLHRQAFVDAARRMESYDNKLIGPNTYKGRPVGQLALFPVECCNSDYTYKSLGPAREQF